MRRGLKNRHLQMIALGGAIGTGLFYGSTSTIALAGPSVMLSYLVGGIVIFFIMRILSATMRRSIGASFQASFPAGITGSTMSW